MAGPDVAVIELTRSINDATIASGQSLSAAIPLKGHTLVGIQMPAAWTAASITLQACATESGTYGDVYEADGTELEFTVSAGQHIILSAAQMISIKNVKVRSGTSGTPVNQGAERSITLLVRDV